MSQKETFLQAFKTSPVVSLSETFVLDTETPISVTYRFLDEPYFVLLEGVSEQVKYDRYSYFGLDPYLRISTQDTTCSLHYNTGKTHTETSNFYDFLEKITRKYRLSKTQHTPFNTGLMGYITYECFSHLEQVPLAKNRSMKSPWAEFIMPQTLLIFDNLYHSVTIVRNCFTEAEQDAETAYNKAKDALEKTKAKLLAPLSHPIAPLPNKIDNYEELNADFNVDKETFFKQVERCKEYIKAGDIFQIQVSRRASVPFNDDPILLYRYLRNYNPSPLLYYLKLDNRALIGASPEILVNAEDNKMIIRPIAGTRKRYSREKTEDEICHELLHDEKEKAEHIMLVDLARNDIGRACKTGSVAVTELMIAEKYTHVIHMVSEVEGVLRDDCTAIDALKYGFPAGTVTGAPKIRAMEIITEMETDQREFYSGGILFLDFTGEMKSALTIRSIYVTEGKAYTQAAAGIVADSIPEMEFLETKNKMRACLSAMHQFRSAT